MANALTFIGSAYLITAVIVGIIATYLNRGLFRRVTKRPLRMAFHALLVGALWPLLAAASIAWLRQSKDTG